MAAYCRVENRTVLADLAHATDQRSPEVRTAPPLHAGRVFNGGARARSRRGAAACQRTGGSSSILSAVPLFGHGAAVGLAGRSLVPVPMARRSFLSIGVAVATCNVVINSEETARSLL